MLTRLLSLCLLLFASVSFAQAGAVTSIQGAPVATQVIASNITTNTTTAVKGGIPNGTKSIVGQVVCSSGACTQTQAIYGAMNTTAADGVLLCTITLTDTTKDIDACPPFTAAFPYYYIVTTSTTGTNATGAVYANY
jgi:hypothetical protein